MRTSLLCFALLLFAACPAWAQDGSKSAESAESASKADGKKSAETKTKTAAKREPTAPIVGVQVKISLKSGGTFKGVRRGPLYVKLEAGRYVEADPKDKGAGVRLFFPRAQKGSVVVAMVLIEEVSELGELSPTEGRHLARSIDRAEERAARERAEAKAAAELAAIEAEKARLLTAASTVEKTAEDLARAAEMAEFAALLSRFPPGTWTDETPDEIAKRRVVLGITPTEEDMAFLKTFETWKKAYAVWKVDQAASAAKAAKAAEAAKEAEAAKAAGEKPAPAAEQPTGQSGSQPASK